MAFADAWNAIQTNLATEANIPNWTVHKGLLGDEFTVSVIASNPIVVESPGAKTPQTVLQKDFEQVYNRWSDYRKGSLRRSEFTPLTRYSKYVISRSYAVADSGTL